MWEASETVAKHSAMGRRWPWPTFGANYTLLENGGEGGQREVAAPALCSPNSISIDSFIAVAFNYLFNWTDF